MIDEFEKKTSSFKCESETQVLRIIEKNSSESESIIVEEVYKKN